MRVYFPENFYSHTAGAVPGKSGSAAPSVLLLANRRILECSAFTYPLTANTPFNLTLTGIINQYYSGATGSFRVEVLPMTSIPINDLSERFIIAPYPNILPGPLTLLYSPVDQFKLSQTTYTFTIVFSTALTGNNIIYL